MIGPGCPSPVTQVPIADFAWPTGETTAAVVSPVGQAKSAMGTWVTGDGQPGPITMQIRNHLLAIQHGTTEDKHGWVQKVAL